MANETKPLDMNAVEMVFGTPSSPKSDVKPNIHIANEKEGKEDVKPSSARRVDSDTESTLPSHPLLEPDRGKPPLAGPEDTDLVEGTAPTDSAVPISGIDDGLLEPTPEKKPDEGDNGNHHHEGSDRGDKELGHDGTNDDGKWGLHDGLDEADYGYGYGDFMGNGLGSRFGEDRVMTPLPPGSIPDVNTYQQKKNLAQGMMDLALLSANANQLRNVLDTTKAHVYFYPSLVFIICSVLLQIAVGVGLIMNSRYNVKDEKDICKADKINNMTILGIFLITIINVFITAFSVATPTLVVAAPVG